MAAKLVKENGVECIQVTVPLEDPRLSAKQKSLIVARTDEVTGVVINGQPVRIQLTAFIKNTAYVKEQPTDMAAMIAAAVAAALKK